MVTWLVVVVVVYWVVNWATPCWCRWSGMFCFGGKFAFELLEIDSSAPLSHGRYLALCIYYLRALTVVVIFVKKTASAHWAVMGQATFMQQLSALLRRNWTYKLRTRNTTLQVYRLVLMYVNCSFMHWKLNPLPVTRKSEPQYSLIRTYCAIRH